MEKKYTPGPWEVCDRDTCHLIYAKGYENQICRVESHSSRVGPGRSEREANAALISAAPSLLEALEQLVSDYERGIHVEFGGSPWLKEKLEELDYARAAIAKAYGK
jgi:ABC-type molybdate transport system substrate-binding protein